MKIDKEIPRIWTKDFVIIIIANFFIFTSFQMTLPTLPLYVLEITDYDTLVGFLVSLAASATILILVIVRVVQGLGWGLSNAASGSIAFCLVPRERRGDGLVYFGLSVNLALAVGPALGLFLVDHMRFASLFL